MTADGNILDNKPTSLPHMPTLKRDREAMDDQGARKKIKTSPVEEIQNIQPIMDLTADEPQTTSGTQIPPSQELQVRIRFTCF